MAERLIFISCGQQTSTEKKLGTDVKELVDSTPGYKAYFAEYVQSLDALAKNIFDGLRKCSGLISFLHERGLVTFGGKECGYRSSVWINQEIAILAYRRQFEGIDIPVLVFKDEKVRLEGAMTSLIVHPRLIVSEQDILTQVESWLKSTVFPSSSSGADDRFASKWQTLSSSLRKVILAIIDEGVVGVKESAIKVCLREKYGMDKKEASQVVRDAGLEFNNNNLVKTEHNIYSGDEMSINSAWEWHIRREIARTR